jgi:hypothetical protein
MNDIYYKKDLRLIAILTVVFVIIIIGIRQFI